MANRRGNRTKPTTVKKAKEAGMAKDTLQDKPILQTIRLDPDRHDALRTLAFTTRRSQHNILLEGVDMVLKKYKGK